MKEKIRSSNTRNKKYDTELSNDSILEYIENEIVFIRNEIESPGWTTWALVVALGYLAWLLADLIKLGDFSPHKTIVVIVFVNYLQLIAEFFLETKSDRFKKELAPTLILMVLRYAAVIYLTYLLSPNISKSVNVVGYVFNSGLLVVMIIIYFLAPWFEKDFGISAYQLTDNARHSESRAFKISFFVGLVVFVIPSIYLSAEYAIYFFSLKPFYSEDIRLAGLICAIYYLIYLLSQTKGESPIIHSLIDLRREFVQGKIEVADLKKRLDVAISGSKISAKLQEYVSELLEIVRVIEKEFSSIVTKEDALEGLYKKRQKAEPTESDNAIIDSLNFSIYQHFLNVSKVYNQNLRDKFLEVDSRDYFSKKFNFADSDSQAIVTKIAVLLDDLKDNYSVTSDRWIDLIEKYESEEIAKKWLEEMNDVYIYDLHFMSEKLADKKQGTNRS